MVDLEQFKKGKGASEFIAWLYTGTQNKPPKKFEDRLSEKIVLSDLKMSLSDVNSVKLKAGVLISYYFLVFSFFWELMCGF